MNIRMLSLAGIFAAVSLTGAASAFSATNCPNASESATKDEARMATILRGLADSGYRIDAFKVTKGRCFEMHGLDVDGKRVEMHFDPVDGKVVKQKRS